MSYNKRSSRSSNDSVYGKKSNDDKPYRQKVSSKNKAKSQSNRNEFTKSNPKKSENSSINNLDKSSNTTKNKRLNKTYGQERIQKKLANLGLGSRREIERLIEQGLVKVNNRTATLGQLIKGDEVIQIKNRKIVLANVNIDHKQRVIAYHKPLGVVCSRKDEKGRKTVFSDLPKIKNARWVMVGRLDINTSGLLLFTNDGQLANQLMHPSSEMNRVYLVRVFGEVNEEAINQLKSGVTLDDGIEAKFNDIQLIEGSNDEAINHHYLVSLSEGKNREVRKLWETVGCQVNRLKRIQYGSFELPKFLKQGKTYELSPKEIKQLQQLLKEKRATQVDN